MADTCRTCRYWSAANLFALMVEQDDDDFDEQGRAPDREPTKLILPHIGTDYTKFSTVATAKQLGRCSVWHLTRRIDGPEPLTTTDYHCDLYDALADEEPGDD